MGDPHHCVCLCGSTALLGLRAWMQFFSSLLHTFCIFETGEWYWLMKPLCLCQLSCDWQWKMREIDGVQRQNCAWSDSWNWLFSFLFPVSRIQSKIGIYIYKKKGLNERTFWQSFRYHQKERGTVSPVSLEESGFWGKENSKHIPFDFLASRRRCERNGHTPRVGPWLHDGIALNRDFFKISIQKCIRCHVSRWWCNFYTTIFVDKTIGTSKFCPYLSLFNWTCTISLTCCLGLFVCQWLPFF